MQVSGKNSNYPIITTIIISHEFDENVEQLILAEDTIF